eukprot:scaffold49_cov409-Prasinococcus_capsulatus_cf.AAC.8
MAWLNRGELVCLLSLLASHVLEDKYVAVHAAVGRTNEATAQQTVQTPAASPFFHQSHVLNVAKVGHCRQHASPG